MDLKSISEQEILKNKPYAVGDCKNWAFPLK